MYTAVPVSGSYPAGEAGSDAIGWTISGAAAKINDNGYLILKKAHHFCPCSGYTQLQSTQIPHYQPCS